MSLRIAIELRPHRIGRLSGIDQSGIGDDPAQPVVHVLVAFDCLKQRLCGIRPFGQISKLTMIINGKSFRLAGGKRQIGQIGRAVEARIEIVQIPFRQNAQIRFSLCCPFIGLGCEMMRQVERK